MIPLSWKEKFYEKFVSLSMRDAVEVRFSNLASDFILFYYFLPFFTLLPICMLKSSVRYRLPDATELILLKYQNCPFLSLVLL